LSTLVWASGLAALPIADGLRIGLGFMRQPSFGADISSIGEQCAPRFPSGKTSPQQTLPEDNSNGKTNPKKLVN
jgi:hypothetical protein